VSISFALPDPWDKRWRLKIRDKETVEPPHVSLLRGTSCWRLDLRTPRFLDKRPAEREVPRKLLKHILGRHDELVVAWDALYPNNPVYPRDTDNGED
jgi:hypothetical protein